MTREHRGLWERLYERRFAPGKGVTKPPPDQGLKRFWFVLSTHFWKLIALNLLFLIFSLPLVTIPAAFCGVNRVLIKLYRDGNCFLWEEYIKEFRTNLWKAMPFGLLGGLCAFASYYFLSLGTSLSPTGVEVFTTAFGILLLAFVVLFLNYVFVFLPTLDLSNRQVARNALIFLSTEWRTNLLILVSFTVMVLFSVLFFPFTLVTLSLISLSFQQYVVCAAVNGPLQKRIIGPYEQKQE